MIVKPTTENDLATNVTNSFVEALTERGVDPIIVARLAKALASGGKPTKPILEDALFSEPTIP